MSSHDFSDAEASCGERGGQRGLCIGILSVGTSDCRVDERDDSTEGLGGGESWVATDGWNGDDERVEILLSTGEATSSSNDNSVSAEGGDDQVGLSELMNC